MVDSDRKQILSLLEAEGRERPRPKNMDVEGVLPSRARLQRARASKSSELYGAACPSTCTMFQQPTYAQPFTMEEALQLDVLIISEGQPRALSRFAAGSVSRLTGSSPQPTWAEISRLRHSIQLLRESNAQILAFLDEEGDDQELRESVEENLITM